jgi:diphthamide synthase (EF-2-diphthine--ammonia ligase)
MFKSGTGLNSKKKVKELRAVISSAKEYDHLDSLVANSWDAKEIMDSVCKAIEARGLAPWWNGVEEYEKEHPFTPPPFNLESLERPKRKQN